MISIPGHEAATAALTSAKTACKASTEKLNLGVNVSSSTPSTDADADSETIRQLDPCTPTSGRDRRVEKTRELLLKFEEQKKKLIGVLAETQAESVRMEGQKDSIKRYAGAGGESAALAMAKKAMIEDVEE